MTYDTFINKCEWIFRDLFNKKMPAEMYVFVNAIWMIIEEAAESGS